MIFLRAVTIARAGRSVACAKVTAADITLRDRVWRARCVRHIAHRSGVGPDSGHIEQLAEIVNVGPGTSSVLDKSCPAMALWRSIARFARCIGPICQPST